MAHWLPSWGIFASLQACVRQTWKEREIHQYSETLVQPTTTCSPSLKHNSVFQSDNSSFPHCAMSQMWCKAPASPFFPPHCFFTSDISQNSREGPREISSFYCSSTVPWLVTEGQHCLTAMADKTTQTYWQLLHEPLGLGVQLKKILLGQILFCQTYALWKQTQSSGFLSGQLQQLETVKKLNKIKE